MLKTGKNCVFFSNFLKNCSLEECQQYKNSSKIKFLTHLFDLKSEHVFWKFQLIRTTFTGARDLKFPKTDKNVAKLTIIILLQPTFLNHVLLLSARKATYHVFVDQRPIQRSITRMTLNLYTVPASN